MERLAIETAEYSTNEDAGEWESLLFADLALTETSAHDIRAGRALTVGPPSPCPGCTWGPPVTNHNETVAADEDDSNTVSARLTDLLLTAEQAEQAKGGTDQFTLGYTRIEFEYKPR